jgi:microcystin-dependent protein
MPIDFPTGPATGQVYTYLGKSWIWNGTGWDVATPNVGDAFLPAGSIIQWSSNTAPANWLICNGAAVSRNTYSSLFAAIGTVYGAGDGTTTFNLPDLRGRVAVGLDATQTEFDTLGESGGAKTHTLTEAQIPSHTHRTGISGSLFYGPGPAGSSTTQVSLDQNVGVLSAATGGGQAHNNLQPYEVLHYIIKASAGTTSGDSELATRLGVVELGKANLAGGNTFTGNQNFNSGVVRIPSQPAFFVAANASTPDNSTIIWNMVRTNIGSGINTSNGRFTAPVAGTYYFGMGGIGHNQPFVTRVFIRVNDAAIFGQFQIRFNNNSEFSGNAVSFALTLAAGDYVTARTTGIAYSDADGGYMHFTGHLIG